MNLQAICISLLLFAGWCTAQNDDLTDNQERLNNFNDIKKNEVSLDVVAGIAGLGINPRYERVLGRYAGVGVDVNIGIEDEDYDYLETFSLTPYYRQYFFSKEDYGAKGFYGEGFMKFFTYEDRFSVFDNGGNSTRITAEKYTELALGVGIGWKWVSDSGFLIDVGFGIGRNLGLADESPEGREQPEITGRGGVNFGWRF
ncbi:hypothetical protein [Nonlabens xiamenensis]|uniref:hypothetical protein n=1 Tax=Nonlabens xiamenensis TaxID=2341043 RepID=UPI000F604BB6|nr:hypothetical protein [Nonlabens xiamenensis]